MDIDRDISVSGTTQQSIDEKVTGQKGTCWAYLSVDLSFDAKKYAIIDFAKVTNNTDGHPMIQSSIRL
uniref:Pept_C1 domain-containing protein n=1 Tax=Ascaris lumbricoides TaxID=6252 RepID=A0A0M3I9H0_ASCLU